MTTSNDNTNRSEFWMAALIALSLLSLLTPWPRPRAVAETPWLAEFATTLVLTVGLVVAYARNSSSITKLFAVNDQATKWLVWLFLAFVLWSVASALWARAPYFTVHHAVVWTEYLLFFLFIRSRCADGDDRLVPDVFAIVAAMLGILCLIEYVTLPDFKSLEGVIRLRYGAYAELLVTVLPVLWAYSITDETPKRRFALFIAGALGWIVVMLSLSKGAFLAGLIGTVAAFAGVFVFCRSYRRSAALSAAAWLVLTAAVQLGFSLLSPVPATVDYMTGAADPSRETALARVFVWKVGSRMVQEHPVLGVGADNFGISFNDARAERRTDHPADPNDEPVSDNLIERGHNELLQVTAELGVIGVVLFTLPFAWLAWTVLRRFGKRNNFSPLLWASLGGMIAFAASSMVSSFSFRLAQNGIAFFIVLAVGMNELRASTPSEKTFPTAAFANAFVAIFCSLSLVLFGTKGYAERCVLDAGREPDIDKAAALYDRAVFLDPAYATAYLNRSGRHYSVGNFEQAAIDLQKAINGGCGVVITYSALAASFEKSNNPDAAERAFNDALRIFPRSVFLRVRFARFLEDARREQEARAQLAVARDIDKRQADGWYNLLTIGSVRAFYAARENADIALPAELKPEAAVLEYLDKPPGEPPQ